MLWRVWLYVKESNTSKLDSTNSLKERVMKKTLIALGLMVAASGAYAAKPVTEELPPEPTEPVIPT